MPVSLRFSREFAQAYLAHRRPYRLGCQCPRTRGSRHRAGSGREGLVLPQIDLLCPPCGRKRRELCRTHGVSHIVAVGPSKPGSGAFRLPSASVDVRRLCQGLHKARQKALKAIVGRWAHSRSRTRTAPLWRRTTGKWMDSLAMPVTDRRIERAWTRFRQLHFNIGVKTTARSRG